MSLQVPARLLEKAEERIKFLEESIGKQHKEIKKLEWDIGAMRQWHTYARCPTCNTLNPPGVRCLRGCKEKT